MATSFYARYVPPVVGQPSQHHEITDDNSSLSKKPKKRQREPELNSTGLELTSKKPKKLKTTSVRTQATQTYTSDNKKKGTKDIQYFKQANALSKDGNHTLPRHDDQITSSKRSRRSSDLDGAREDKIKRRISNFEGVDGEFIDKKPPKINHDHDLNAHLADDLEKHKKIRSKYEKSSKVATKLAKKNKASAEFANDTGELHAEPKAETYGLVPLPQPPIIPDTLKDLGFSALPDWLAKPIVIHSSDTVPFQTFPLSSVVTASLKGKGYENTFAIQSAILPMLLPGPNHYAGDICISAPTGSGKTLTYVLPMVEALRDKPIIRLRGLIVVPTRELVAQAREAVEVCSSGTGLRVETAVGNRTLKDEQDAIIEKSQTYDPEAYREIRNRKSTIEDLMDWDDDDNQDDEYKCLTNFVVHYTSKVDILICTPGRLVDHVKFTKGFTLQHITWFVVDEADRLLDQSFQRWVDIVSPALQSLPKRDPREELLSDLFHTRERREIQKIILSATMTRDISKLMALKLSSPRLVVLGNKLEGGQEANSANSALIPALSDPTSVDLPSSLMENAVPVKYAEDKPLYFLQLLSSEVALATHIQGTGRHKSSRLQVVEDDGDIDSISESDNTSSDTSSSLSFSGKESSRSPSPISKKPFVRTASFPLTLNHSTLIFTNNNENALRLARLLILLRPSWANQIGTLTKSTATSSGRRTLKAFRNRHLSVLIASDRASRGLDVQDLAHVINYDMPTSLTSYVHRVGRTARAGKVGTATTLVCHHEAHWFWKEIGRAENVHRGLGKKIRRIEGLLDSVNDEDRGAYEMALKELGREARGEIV